LIYREQVTTAYQQHLSQIRETTGENVEGER
jgi:hypothetical protein